MSREPFMLPTEVDPLWKSEPQCAACGTVLTAFDRAWYPISHIMNPGKAAKDLRRYFICQKCVDDDKSNLNEVARAIEKGIKVFNVKKEKLVTE